MSLCCNAFITVMKATHLRNCDNSPGARHLPRKGTLLVEPQMGSGPMVVTEIRSQSSLQMHGVQDDEMVQAVSSDRADQAFGVRILPGTPRCSEYLFNAHCRNPQTDDVAVDAIPIANQIRRRIAHGSGLEAPLASP